MDRESRAAADTGGLLLNRLEISAPSERRLGSAIERGALTVSPRLRVAEPKLMLPRVHPRALRRARLLEMLDHLDGAALTVLNAGVGYGKTTLLRSWCTERPEPVAWITLDTADDDPVRLWTHLAHAGDRSPPG